MFHALVLSDLSLVSAARLQRRECAITNKTSTTLPTRVSRAVGQKTMTFMVSHMQHFIDLQQIDESFLAPCWTCWRSNPNPFNTISGFRQQLRTVLRGSASSNGLNLMLRQ